jgi:FlaA1/EpsC-like NDP-sugar epimerase
MKKNESEFHMSATTGRLAGKRVLITGTGGGQGEAAQRLFAREATGCC